MSYLNQWPSGTLYSSSGAYDGSLNTQYPQGLANGYTQPFAQHFATSMLASSPLPSNLSTQSAHASSFPLSSLSTQTFLGGQQVTYSPAVNGWPTRTTSMPLSSGTSWTSSDVLQPSFHRLSMTSSAAASPALSPNAGVTLQSQTTIYRIPLEASQVQQMESYNNYTTQLSSTTATVSSATWNSQPSMPAQPRVIVPLSSSTLTTTQQPTNDEISKVTELASSLPSLPTRQPTTASSPRSTYFNIVRQQPSNSPPQQRTIFSWQASESETAVSSTPTVVPESTPAQPKAEAQEVVPINTEAGTSSVTEALASPKPHGRNRSNRSPIETLEDIEFVSKSPAPVLLDHFLSDMLQDRPEDPLEYLRDWAKSQDGNAIRELMDKNPNAPRNTPLLYNVGYICNQKVLEFLRPLMVATLSKGETDPTNILKNWVVNLETANNSEPLSPKSDNTDRSVAQELLNRLLADVLKDHPNNFQHYLKDWTQKGGEHMAVAVDRNLLGDHEDAIKALVVDCGTGETKMLLYTFDRGTISFEEPQKVTRVQQYLDEPQKFVELVALYSKNHNASTTLVGASSWMRTAEKDELKKGNDLLHQLMQAGLACKVLEHSYEGWLEATAVEYVSWKGQKEFNCSWASGGGSTQLCMQFEEIFGLTLGSSKGIELISSKGVVKGGQEWRQDIQEEIANFEKQTSSKLSGNICAMSGVCFAALGTKKRLQTETYYSVSEVQEAFQKTIEELEQKGIDEDLPTSDLRNLSNLILQSSILQRLVLPDARIYFMRDVKLDGEDFRITWSCGWFISLLWEIGALEVNLKSLSKLQKESDPAVKAGDWKEVKKVAQNHALCSLTRIMDVMLEKARNTEAIVTPILQDIAKEFDGRLEGLQFKLKGRDSLQRKLSTKLAGLLDKHKYEPFYVPRLEHVTEGVDDILRYTIVCPEKTYAQAVEKCVTEMNKIPESKQCNYDNYWIKDSTYFGVTFWVTRDDFTFELQFHTDYSLHTKEAKSHKLYEIFRLLQPSKEKLLLYRTLKAIWNHNKLPPEMSLIKKPKPFSDRMMEQFQQVQQYKDAFLRNHKAQDPAGPEGRTAVPEDFHSPQGDSHSGAFYDGLCGRLVRGTRDGGEDQFEMLCYPHDKRIAWFGGTEMLNACLSYDAHKLHELIANYQGKPSSWVAKKLKNNDYWRLVVLPEEYCKSATWDGLLNIIIVQYPEVAPIVARFKNALEKTTFKDIEAMLGDGDTFRIVKDAGEKHPKHMTLKKLRKLPSLQLWHVRGFLYNVIGVNELYHGDGFTYNDAGEKSGPEFICENRKISDMPSCHLFPVFHYIPAEE